MKVTAILKGSPDQFGRYAVTLRKSTGQKRIFKVTGIRLTKDQLVKGFVVNHPQASVLNRKIRISITDFEREKEVAPVSYQQYLNDCLIQWARTKKESTLYRIKGDNEVFLKWAHSPLLSGITVQMLNRYKVHLFTQVEESNTVWRHFKNIKTVVNKAFREGVISSNPFASFENIKYKNPPKEHLTKDQIQAIEDYLPHAPERIAFIATWFLIGCYTGLRFSDMVAFDKKKHITSGRLVLRTVKTDEIVSLPVNEKIKSLFEKIQYRPLNLSNGKYNKYLKVLSNATELPTINAHMSRHTFAVRCAEAGLSPEVTAKLMGILDMKVVAVYYKIGSTRIDDEYQRLFQ